MGRGRSLGLIAGEGALPGAAATALRRAGVPITLFGFRGIGASHAITEENRLPLGALSALRERLVAQGVREVLIVGRFDLDWLAPGTGHAPAVAPPIEPDAEARALLAGMTRLDGATLMGAIAGWLEDQGVTLVAQDTALCALMMEPGVLTRRAPSTRERAAVEPALRALAEGAGGPLAQSVAIRDGEVVGIEDAAGTDALIARVGQRAHGAALTIVKAARPGQDRRLDLPAAGEGTIEAMRSAGATALALEAGSVLLVDREALRAAADHAGIAVWGFTRESRAG